MFKLYLMIFIVLIRNRLTQAAYYEWLPNKSMYQNQSGELIGHGYKTVDSVTIVTQCAMACLKQSKCLSYNFNPADKKCQLNDATHFTHPSDFRYSDSTQYYLRGYYAIDQKADPCLSLPCSNDASCLSRSDNSFTCLCSPDWTGVYCETRVDISWSSWSAWSDCSKKCGDGVKQRKRTCYDKVADIEMSSRLCHGDAIELEHCVIKDCPYWGQWFEWSACSTSNKCGQGTSRRSRTCLNSDLEITCFGLANDSRICQSIPCNAQVSIIQNTADSFGEGTLQMLDSDWLLICSSDWTQANANVACRQMGFEGGAYSSQFAPLDLQTSLKIDFQCQGDEPTLITCPHSDWSVGDCKAGSKIILKCVVDGRWSSWGQWSECSVSCSDGSSTRTRNCTSPSQKFGGRVCEGSDLDSKPCTNPPCPVDGAWMNWNSWSACNASCGGGVQSRVRFCIEPKNGGRYCSGSNQEMNNCNANMCPVDGTWASWGEWSGCSVSCGGGKRIKSRSCNPPKFGGKDCPAEGAKSEDFCNDDPCKIDGQWSLWSRWMDCSVTCGTGVERRYRDCTVPENGGNTCEGQPEEHRDCNLELCPTPAQWSPWSTWSGCSSTCGNSGSRSRKRICNQTTEGVNSLPCLGFNSSQETKDCNRLSCTPTVKNCQEAFDRGLEENSFVQISLVGGSKPVTVFCYQDAGKIMTAINSSYEQDQWVNFTSGSNNNNNNKRSFRVIYTSNDVQVSTDNLKTIVYNSKECKQFVKWKCRNFPINSPSGARLVYWKNQYSDEMAYWGNATAVAATGSSKPTVCSCGDKGTCPPFKCSCDKNLTTWYEDGGWLDNKYDLPLTEMVVMDTGYSQQEGKFSVGSLICN